MNRLVTFLILLICLYACGESVKEKNKTINTNASAEIKAEDELKLIEQNGRSFYDWYFKNDFPNCDIVKDKNRKCFLDTTSYFQTLRRLGTISEKFITAEKERLQGCAEFLSTLDYAEYQKAEAYDYDQYCGEIYFMFWIKTQEPPDTFSVRNIQKNRDTSASLDIYTRYTGGQDEPLSTVSLEKEENIWKITFIKFIKQDPLKVSTPITDGKWYGGIVALNIGDSSLAFEYHGQCVYFYPVKKINEDEFEMLWAREMDCKFDNGTDKKFGLADVPNIGQPFAKYTLKNNILHVEYYQKDWVKAYTEQIQEGVFVDKYFRKADDH